MSVLLRTKESTRDVLRALKDETGKSISDLMEEAVSILKARELSSSTIPELPDLSLLVTGGAEGSSSGAPYPVRGDIWQISLPQNGSPFALTIGCDTEKQREFTVIAGACRIEAGSDNPHCLVFPDIQLYLAPNGIRVYPFHLGVLPLKRLERCVGRLSPSQMQLVDTGLRTCLQL